MGTRLIGFLPAYSCFLKSKSMTSQQGREGSYPDLPETGRDQLLCVPQAWESLDNGVGQGPFSSLEKL